MYAKKIDDSVFFCLQKNIGEWKWDLICKFYVNLQTIYVKFILNNMCKLM